jgi:hypoxanthine phosphoribosyltransferase
VADLHVDWDEYHRLIERLALAVRASGWDFDQIVCIARGGLRVGDTLSRIFAKPLAIIATASYAGEGGTERGALTIASAVTMTTASLGPRVLLVDDLVDSGVTLAAVKAHLLDRARFPDLREVRTAVLWYKACSACRPDWFVVHLADSPWIHQPFERYEGVTWEELATPAHRSGAA